VSSLLSQMHDGTKMRGAGWWSQNGSPRETSKSQGIKDGADSKTGTNNKVVSINREKMERFDPVKACISIQRRVGAFGQETRNTGKQEKNEGKKARVELLEKKRERLEAHFFHLQLHIKKRARPVPFAGPGPG